METTTAAVAKVLGASFSHKKSISQSIEALPVLTPGQLEEDDMYAYEVHKSFWTHVLVVDLAVPLP